MPRLNTKQIRPDEDTSGDMQTAQSLLLVLSITHQHLLLCEQQCEWSGGEIRFSILGSMTPMGWHPPPHCRWGTISCLATWARESVCRTPPPNHGWQQCFRQGAGLDPKDCSGTWAGKCQLCGGHTGPLQGRPGVSVSMLCPLAAPLYHPVAAVVLDPIPSSVSENQGSSL